MLTVLLILAILALGVCIYSAVKSQSVLWVAVALLCVIELVRALPVGR